MKRGALLGAFALLFVFLQACSPTNDQNLFAASDKTKEEALSFFGTPEFSDAVRDNPIDTAFRALELGVSTNRIIQECRVFTDYWQAEIDKTVERLQTFLCEDDIENLLISQQAWQTYMNANYALMKSAFDVSERNNIAYGTLDWGLANSHCMEETRKRALELMEYYYRFTGEVNFVFEGDEH